MQFLSDIVNLIQMIENLDAQVFIFFSIVVVLFAMVFPDRVIKVLYSLVLLMLIWVSLNISINTAKTHSTQQQISSSYDYNQHLNVSINTAKTHSTEQQISSSYDYNQHSKDHRVTPEEFRENFGHLSKDVKGQEIPLYEIKHLTTSMLQKENTGPLTMIFSGHHGLGKNMVEGMVADSLNNISLCKQDNNVDSCFLARGYIKIPTMTLHDCSEVHKRITRFVPRAKDKNFVPVIVFDEVQQISSFGQCLLDLVNGQSIYDQKRNDYVSLSGCIIIITVNLYALPNKTNQLIAAQDFLDKYSFTANSDLSYFTVFNELQFIRKKTNIAGIISEHLQSNQTAPEIFAEKTHVIPFTRLSKNQLIEIVESNLKKILQDHGIELKEHNLNIWEEIYNTCLEPTKETQRGSISGRNAAIIGKLIGQDFIYSLTSEKIEKGKLTISLNNNQLSFSLDGRNGVYKLDLKKCKHK